MPYRNSRFYLFPASVLFYIIMILLFDAAGFFTAPPRDTEGLYRDNAVLEGTVTSPETEKRRFTEFTLRTEKIDGIPADFKFVARRFRRKTQPVPLPAVRQNDRITLRGRIIRPFSRVSQGGFNYAKYLARKNIYALVNAKEVISARPGNPGFFGRLIASLHESMAGAIERNLPEKEASVLVMMFTGKRGAISDDIKRIFTDAGVTHILVVSGSNVVYVVAIFFFLFRMLPVRNAIRYLLLAPVVVVYCFITGADPPIVRATVMTLALISCYILRRERAVYHAFALAALVILLFDPQSIFSASFQLSFAACLGLVYMAPKFAGLLRIEKLPKVFRWVLYLFFVSLSAQLGVMPLLAYYFSKLSLVSLVSNLFVVPFSGVILWLCFALFFAAELFPFLVPLFKFLCLVSAKLLLFAVSFFAHLPHAAVSVPRPGALSIALYYLCLATTFTLIARFSPAREQDAAGQSL
jgi:competence protein ComEC